MRIFDTEGLKWRAAFKRAGFFVAIWLLSIYVLGEAFPETFPLGIDSGAGLVTLLTYGVFFFFFFVVMTAYTERSKARRIAQQKAQKKGGSGAGTAARTGTAEGTNGTGALKGRHNPNTSRKKATRRRRR